MKIRRQTGQSLVEFALVLPMFMLIVMGIFEVSRAIFIWTQLSGAAREGSRYGAISPTDELGITEAIKSKIVGISADEVNISIWCDNGDFGNQLAGGCSSAQPGADRIVVEPQYEFHAIVPLLTGFWPSFTVRFTSARTILGSGGGSNPGGPPPTFPPAVPTQTGTPESVPTATRGSASPTVTETPGGSTATPTPGGRGSPTATTGNGSTATPAPSATTEPTSGPTSTGTVGPASTGTTTATVTRTPTATPTGSPATTATVTRTPTPGASSTATSTPAGTATSVPGTTPTTAPDTTPTTAPTATATTAPAATATTAPTSTPSTLATPTATAAPSNTPQSTNTATPSATPTATSTATATATPDVTVADVRNGGNNNDLSEEYVEVVNAGGSANITGWTLSDEGGNTFTFPAFTLSSGGSVRVWTTSGANSLTDLYWGQSSAVWAKNNECATLSNNAGQVVDHYCY